MPEHSLTPELLAAYSVVADPQLSPNGEWVLYTIGEASHEGEHPNGAVWLTSFRDGGARQFTAGTALDAASRWSPDGGAIAFVSDRAEPGKPRLYTVPFAGGEATLVETPPGEVSDPRWSPDGAYLAYRLTEPETEEDKRRKEERDDVEVAGETYKYARLFVTHLDTGESRRISAEKRHVRDFDWSPDGGRLAVATADTPEDDEDHLPGRIEVFDLESGEARTLAEPLGAVLDLRWSPDVERVAYVGMASRSGAAEAVCVLPVENGEPAVQSRRLCDGAALAARRRPGVHRA
ncbi:MAG: hypothetical protein WKH64_07140 [Chloroflexia bacterium]